MIAKGKRSTVNYFLNLAAILLKGKSLAQATVVSGVSLRQPGLMRFKTDFQRFPTVAFSALWEMRDEASKCTTPFGNLGRSTLPVQWLVWADDRERQKINEKNITQSLSLRCTSNMDLLGQLWRREGGGRMVIICKTSAHIRIPIHHSVTRDLLAHRNIIQRVAFSTMTSLRINQFRFHLLQI